MKTDGHEPCPQAVQTQSVKFLPFVGTEKSGTEKLIINHPTSHPYNGVVLCAKASAVHLLF